MTKKLWSTEEASAWAAANRSAKGKRAAKESQLPWQERKPGHYKLTDEQVVQVRALYYLGATTTFIARAFDITVNMARMLAKGEKRADCPKVVFVATDAKPKSNVVITFADGTTC